MAPLHFPSSFLVVGLTTEVRKREVLGFNEIGCSGHIGPVFKG